MVDANLCGLYFAVGKSSVLQFDLLVWSPEIEVMWCRRIEEQKYYGNNGGKNPERIEAIGLQDCHSRQNEGEPYGGRQSEPRYGKESDDACEASGQVPRVTIERPRSEVELTAYGLPNRNKNVSD